MARKTKADALKTRQQLIDAAIEQFAARGVAETTLTDIADAAGVTRGAVYWHFTNKTELFNAMWQQQTPLPDIISHKLDAMTRDNPLVYLREMLITALQYIAETPRLRALMHILYHKCEFGKDMLSEKEIRQRIGFNETQIRTLLHAGVQNGYLSASTNIEMVLIILHGFLCGVIKNWLIEPERLNLYQQAPVLVDNIMLTLHPPYFIQPVMGAPSNRVLPERVL